MMLYIYTIIGPRGTICLLGNSPSWGNFMCTLLFLNQNLWFNKRYDVLETLSGDITIYMFIICRYWGSQVPNNVVKYMSTPWCQQQIPHLDCRNRNTSFPIITDIWNPDFSINLKNLFLRFQITAWIYI